MSGPLEVLKLERHTKHPEKRKTLSGFRRLSGFATSMRPRADAGVMLMARVGCDWNQDLLFQVMLAGCF